MAEWPQEFKTLLIEKVRKILTDAGIYVLDALGNLSQAVVKALWAKIEQAIIDFCRQTLGIEVTTLKECGSVRRISKSSNYRFIFIIDGPFFLLCKPQTAYQQKMKSGWFVRGDILL
ncbi:hypothetical protein CEXT_659801 [Caerostris extrusa]|uniref:Uncharacterized protein n=1 Tax=Caerostris extrusa TaxID=172846 RepID=A0AAV4PJF3_CAEEX|nr:hypothetical protein CEXT_659801 [Caerostris extrusa]